MRKFMFFLAALALMGVIAFAISYGIRSDSGTGHHQGAISGDGKPIPTTCDANGRLWVRDQNTRGSSLTTVVVDTWTALSTIGDQRYLQVVCRNTTDAATCTLNIWMSDDGGTTYYPAVRADTLAKAKDVSIDVGTNFNPTEGAALANVDTVVVAVGPATHLYLDAEAGATAGFTFFVGGL